MAISEDIFTTFIDFEKQFEEKYGTKLQNYNPLYIKIKDL